MPMETPMRRALGRAGWALMTAGALGLTPSLEAQTPQLLPGGPTGHSLPKSQISPAAAAKNDSAKLEEMKVELALLADPVTFSFSLGARASGAALELRGYVPNDVV